MQRVLFSFSDLLFARNTDAYASMRTHLDRVMPGHNFHFPKKSALHDLPHPLAAPDDIRANPVCWIEMFWDRFAEYHEIEIKPALDDGKNVILDGWSFDALLMLSLVAWDARHELAERHHAREAQLFGKYPPRYPMPTYFLVRSRCARDEFARFQAVDPGTQVSEQDFVDLCRKAKIIQDDFFNDERQLPSFSVDGNLSTFGKQAFLAKHLCGVSEPLTQAA